MTFLLHSYAVVREYFQIVWDRPGFHSERYIWPVGFCSSRYYPSMKTPDMKCIYTCKILDGGYGPTVSFRNIVM